VGADAGPVVRLQRPPAASHLLEGHTPDEEPVGRLTLLAQRLLEVAAIDVGARAGRVEPARCEIDDSVEGDLLGDHQVSHAPPDVRGADF
jgi:hypothetical protein